MLVIVITGLGFVLVPCDCWVAVLVVARGGVVYVLLFLFGVRVLGFVLVCLCRFCLLRLLGAGWCWFALVFEFVVVLV